MNERAVAAVIRAAGGTAYILRDGAERPFRASIQPQFRETGRRGSPIGVGERLRYILYADCGEAALTLARGDEIRWKDGRYLVERVETLWLAGEAVCRKGELARVEEE